MSLLVMLGLADQPIADAVTESYLEAIGALLHARTNAGGIELGTFTEETRPNRDQVIELLEQAAGDLDSRIPVEVPSKYEATVRRLVALQAASLVEASYFPNELDTDRSAYRQYQAMYLNGVEALRQAVLQPGALRLV